MRVCKDNISILSVYLPGYLLPGTVLTGSPQQEAGLEAELLGLKQEFKYGIQASQRVV